MDWPLSNFLDDYHKIMRVTIVAQIIIIILIFFASAGQSSRFYYFLRMILPLLFLIVAFLDQARERKIFIYFWIIFATFFNPLFPIYFHIKESWQQIDIMVFIITVISLLFNIVIYYNGFQIANHVERRARIRYYVDIIQKLFIDAENYFHLSYFETRASRKNMYLNTSENICKILIDNDPLRAEFWLLKGVVKAKQYRFHMAIPDFKKANNLDKRIIIPNEEEIKDLTSINYKTKLYSVEN